VCTTLHWNIKGLCYKLDNCLVLGYIYVQLTYGVRTGFHQAWRMRRRQLGTGLWPQRTIHVPATHLRRIRSAFTPHLSLVFRSFPTWASRLMLLPLNWTTMWQMVDWAFLAASPRAIVGMVWWALKMNRSWKTQMTGIPV